jgi:hypothetical protein
MLLPFFEYLNSIGCWHTEIFFFEQKDAVWFAEKLVCYSALGVSMKIAALFFVQFFGVYSWSSRFAALLGAALEYVFGVNRFGVR